MRTPEAGTTVGKCTFCKDYIIEGTKAIILFGMVYIFSIIVLCL